MKHLITRAGFLLPTFFLLISTVNAGGVTKECKPVYGGGVECPREGVVIVDKKVKNPASGVFVDNLGPNDPRFRPQQTVTFQVRIMNNGDTHLTQVHLRDIFPKVNGRQVIDFMSSSVSGNYDANTNTLSITMPEIKSGQSRTVDITGRVVHQAALTSKENIICPVPGNIAEVTSGSQSDRDEARFCIEKETPVKEVPQAGPVSWIFSIGSLIGALSGGVYLRRKSA